jgi:hypothetical protein
MARIWSELYNPSRHRNRMRGIEGVSPVKFKAPTLVECDIYFVRVCSFTFEFHSVEQIRLCHAYYAKKLHPSSRANISGLCPGFEHYDAQRWFEQLPLYLREEPKRIKVVAALESALRQYDGGCANSRLSR